LRVLARQFVEMGTASEVPAEFTLVEAGAGVGRFAATFLDFCEAHAPLFMVPCGTLPYERSAFETRTGKDRNEAPRDRRHFTASPGSGAHRGRVLFSNELVDALAGASGRDGKFAQAEACALVAAR